ncbi:MAG: TlyA family RNA methyltransferase [Paucibacter sp.]|nr:TlyA family RNA methyltransferase [Roseateles sp.]
MRADQLLVAKGLAPTRSAAQRLIEHGAVLANGRILRKAGEDLTEHAELVVTDDAELRYVSRGGLKLEGALKTSGIEVAGRHALDIGQSTGGFTDVLLKAGAAHVTGIDVGHSQLHTSLREDARVTALENTHVREYQPAQAFELIVGDLSFISMLGELERISRWLAPAGQLLLLIKPQFELGKKALNKGGLIKDRKQYIELEERSRAAVEPLALTHRGWFESPVTGGDGNTEFFLWAQAK